MKGQEGLISQGSTSPFHHNPISPSEGPWKRNGARGTSAGAGSLCQEGRGVWLEETLQTLQKGTPEGGWTHTSLLTAAADVGFESHMELPAEGLAGTG